MKSRIIVMVLIVWGIVNTIAEAQNELHSKRQNPCFIGSTFFLLGNFDQKNKPDFWQINLGYSLSPKDRISIEWKTWKYQWPLGIPYGSSFEAPEYQFPGFIREFGIAPVYQRFWWKGWYSSIHVMTAWQSFVDENDNKVGKGFQIFNTYRIGYHFPLFKRRFFIEPSIAITHRLYHTDMPRAFKKVDDPWSKFFFGEPGLHFGFLF